MSFESQGDSGGLRSPGGFEFGVQGWSYGEAKPTSITFFLDGTAMVCDQYGRPIKGAVTDGKYVFFAINPPSDNIDRSMPYERRYHEEVQGGKVVKKSLLATHAQVIATLAAERIDWLKLNRAGTPQLPYEDMKKIPNLPIIEETQLRRIPDPELRKAALRIRREVNAVLERELQAVEEE